MTAPASRIAGVDAWRAGLMVGGILFHAVPEGTGEPPLLAVHYVSTHFRMGAFMLISGFLAGMLAGRSDPAHWLASRFLRILVPLLTGAAITLPAMAALRIAASHAAVGAITLWANWYHLWFLVALLAYLPLTRLLAFGPAGEEIARRLLSTRAPGTGTQLRLILVLCGAGFCLFVLGLFVSALPVPGPTLLNMMPQILGYAPLYAMGILLGRSEPLRRQALGGARVPLALIAAMVAVELAAVVSLGEDWAGFRTIVQALSGVTLPALGSLLILRSALAVRRVPLWVPRLSKAALTVYLVHFPIIKLLQALLHGFRLPPYAEYLAVIGITALAAFGIHAFAVARSPVLLWLFNGRRMTPAAPERPGLPV
jgi:glucans biosynthesis protein C